MNTELLIVFGCNEHEELKGRMELALEVYKDRCKIPNTIVALLYTGTKEEFSFVKENINLELINLISETSSKNTIDNVINSFVLISQQMNYFKSINVIHLISSSYHLSRISFIISTLQLYKDIKLEFHGSKLFNLSRLENEDGIKNNIEQYQQSILNAWNEKINNLKQALNEAKVWRNSQTSD